MLIVALLTIAKTWKPHKCPSIDEWQTALLCSCCSLSRVQLFETQWTAAQQSSLSFTIFLSLLKLMSIELVMPSNHLILCRPLLLLPSIFPSIKVFSNELALYIRWPKHWSFSISPFNEYSGLISFRIDWLDLLAVQRTLKSLLQHHSSKTSILWHSVFFMVQLSHLYMTTRKTIALIIWTFYIVLSISNYIVHNIYRKAQMNFMVNPIYTTPPSFNLSEPQLFHL